MKPVTIEQLVLKVSRDSESWTAEQKQQVRDELLVYFFGPKPGEVIQ